MEELEFNRMIYAIVSGLYEKEQKGFIEFLGKGQYRKALYYVYR